jgi:type IV secretion system protein VirD4
MQRRLAFADELMRLPADRQVLLIENMQPIQAQKIAWFDDPTLAELGQSMNTAA